MKISVTLASRAPICRTSAWVPVNQARLIALALLVMFAARPLHAADVFMRIKLTEPSTGHCYAIVGGFGHAGVWHMPDKKIDAHAGEWGEWFDMSKWPLHGRMERSGGI